MAVTQPRAKLLPFEPNNEIHIAELRRQRILCGWGTGDVDGWLLESRAGDKGLFWVLPTSAVQLDPFNEPLSLRSGIGPPPPNLDFQPIGHISLDWIDYKGDSSLASRENGLITIASFFLLKSQQGQRFGSACMEQLEDQARKDPAVKALTLNVMYGEDASRREMWDMLGVEFDPNKAVLQSWYTRRGYVQYAMKPRYEEKNAHTGETVLLNAALMRMEIRGADGQLIER